ncbi:hypothetical protein KXS07_15365 [Inquilinus limosus]|uniref:SecDF P1 head subdomain-containing protein n=1 Tax=Inquilinus limosus TaxID=171674 RepID=UPI003F167FD1
MLSVISTLTATVVVLSTALTTPLDVPRPPPISAGPTVEFRLAETKPGPGLTSIENDGRTLYLRPEIIVSTQDIACAVQGVDAWSGQPTVTLVLNDAGRDRLATTTTRQVGKILAVMIDGTLRMAPVIREPILGGGLQISGQFSLAEAMDLATKLGRPPAPRRLSLADALIGWVDPSWPAPGCFT